ncbi:hypothetical protein FQN57_001234 [Myotisia sp. PD_48]|nr:hypothetical protein FQN57_001234 [Myotisia sp. PD_48]
MNSHHGYAYPAKESLGVRGNRHEPLSARTLDNPPVAYAVASLTFVYFLLHYLDLLPYTFRQILWRIVVYLTPTRLVTALDMGKARTDITPKDIATTGFRSFREKSEAMQRILGLEGSSLFPSFPRSGAYSSLSNALLGSNKSFPPGLGNWDNSCYQNSIIQGLASLRPLREFLATNLEKLGPHRFLPTHTALKTVIDQLNDPSNHGRKLWIPAELKSMCSWQQQDAQEYFSKLVDQVDKEIWDASKGFTNNMGFKLPNDKRPSSENDSPSQEAPISNNQQLTQDSGWFSNPLEGLLAQRVGCMRCGFTEGLSLIPFNCLTVTLGQNWEYDVRDCLDEYTALEPIEGVECAKCTLLWAKTQLQQLLEQMGPASEADDGSDSVKLTNALRQNAEVRLKAVQESLEDEDFSDKNLSGKCHVSPRNRVSSTKSKQAVIARPPRSLIIHINRSVFDEMTGTLKKNYADVRFPKTLNLGEWCLGSSATGGQKDPIEIWGVDPSESLLGRSDNTLHPINQNFELKAVVTHYGRHENGHYICYRKYSSQDFPTEVTPSVIAGDYKAKDQGEHWFRLSDEDVSLVSESSVMSQGGVFMLCYDHVENLTASDGGTETSIPVEDFKIKGNDRIPLVDITNNIHHMAGVPAFNQRTATGSESTRSSASSCEIDSPSSYASDIEDQTDPSSTTTTTQHVANIMRTGTPSGIENSTETSPDARHPVSASMIPAM